MLADGNCGQFSGPTSPTQAAAVTLNRGYIVGPAYDWFFFILSPLLAVGIGYASWKSGAAQLFMVYRGPGHDDPCRSPVLAPLAHGWTNSSAFRYSSSRLRSGLQSDRARSRSNGDPRRAEPKLASALRERQVSRLSEIMPLRVATQLG